MFSKYSELGFQVVPITPGTKAVYLDNWQRWSEEKQTTDFIDYLETTYKDYGVGIVLGKASGIVAVDLDFTEGIPVEFKAKFPLSTVGKCGAKGGTFFYRYNESLFNQKIHTPYGPIDILITGRQTVMPPSIHPGTEEPYYWLTPDTLENCNISDLPILTNGMLDLIPRAESNTFASSGSDLSKKYYHEANCRDKECVKLRVNRCPHGSYNRIISFASGKIASCCSIEDGIKALIEWDQAHHFPPYLSDKTRSECASGDPWKSADKIYRNILDSHNKARIRKGEVPHTPRDVPVIQFNPSPIKEEKIIRPPRLGGAIDTCVNGILSISRGEQYDLALGASLAINATLAGNKFKTEQGTPIRTNLFVLNVGNSSVGKNAGFLFANKLFGRYGLDEYYYERSLRGMSNYSSEAAMAEQLEKQKQRLDLIDEFARILKGLNTPGSFASLIGETLKELYNSSDEFRGHQTKEKLVGRVSFPCISLLGGVQPSELRDHAKAGTIYDGLLPRFLYFFEDTSAEWLGNQFNELSQRVMTHICDEIKSCYPVMEALKDCLFEPGKEEPYAKWEFKREEVKLTQQLIKHRNEWDKEDYDTMLKNYRDGDTLAGAMRGKVGEKVERLMYIIALANARREVTLDDWEKAYAVATYSSKMVASLYSESVSVGDKEQERLILNLLKATHDNGMSYKQIRNTKGIVRGDKLRRMLADMAEAEEITVSNSSNGQGKVYKIKSALHPLK